MQDECPASSAPPRIEVGVHTWTPHLHTKERTMRNDEFMLNAGFIVPVHYEPYRRVSPVKETFLDGADIVLRVGDFPVAGGVSEKLLEEWGAAARYSLDDVDPVQALDILFLSVLTMAVHEERAKAGLDGSVGIAVDSLRRRGAPERFADYSARIDGDFLMAMIADQFDPSVQRGGPLRTAVKRRRRDGARRAAA